MGTLPVQYPRFHTVDNVGKLDRVHMDTQHPKAGRNRWHANSSGFQREAAQAHAGRFPLGWGSSYPPRNWSRISYGFPDSSLLADQDVPRPMQLFLPSRWN